MSYASRVPLVIAGAGLIATITAGVTRDTTVPVAEAATGAACPLTVIKQKEAVLAFEEMMPVIRHPRCSNCHGGVNPLVPYAQGKHLGGFIDTTQIAHSSVQTIRAKCQECHSELPGWDTPGPPMHWNGKTTQQICEQFKRLSQDPNDFIAHITNEHGGVQFIEAAFKGERALNDMAKDIPMDEHRIPFVVDPPPGTRADLIQDGTAWANAVGPQGWTATPSCGCEVRANAWVGSATTTLEMTTPGLGHFTEQATASVWFDYNRDQSEGTPDEYWKSTGGSITWTSRAAGGQCTGSSSGSLRIGLGADDNPMASIAFSPQAGGAVRYHLSNGPWKDADMKTITLACPDNTLLMAAPMYASWWLPGVFDPEGRILSDENQLSGSHRWTVGDNIVQTWSWNLRRLRGPRPVR